MLQKRMRFDILGKDPFQHSRFVSTTITPVFETSMKVGDEYPFVKLRLEPVTALVAGSKINKGIVKALENNAPAKKLN